MKINFNKWIYTIFTLFFIFIIIYTLTLKDRFYIFESVLFIIFSSLFYFNYKEMNFNLFTYLLINVGMSLHQLGRFGFYGIQLFGVNWDIYTHFVGSIGIAMIVYNALKTRVNLKEKGFFKYFLLIVFLASVTVALIGEFSEFGGTIFFENGQGLLGIEGEAGPYPNISTDYWDTMTDLLANAAGSLAGIGICVLFFRRT